MNDRLIISVLLIALVLLVAVSCAADGVAVRGTGTTPVYENSQRGEVTWR